jgi:hypothetical protein
MAIFRGFSDIFADECPQNPYFTEYGDSPFPKNPEKSEVYL